MASVTRSHRRQRRRSANLSVCATALLNDMRREQEQHADIDAFYAPSECHECVTPHDPEVVLRKLGRTVKWFERECAKRGVSSKWLYMHGLPYPINRSLCTITF